MLNKLRGNIENIDSLGKFIAFVAAIGCTLIALGAAGHLVAYLIDIKSAELMAEEEFYLGQYPAGITGGNFYVRKFKCRNVKQVRIKFTNVTAENITTWDGVHKRRSGDRSTSCLLILSKDSVGKTQIDFGFAGRSASSGSGLDPDVSKETQANSGRPSNLHENIPFTGSRLREGTKLKQGQPVQVYVAVYGDGVPQNLNRLVWPSSQALRRFSEQHKDLNFSMISLLWSE